MYSKIKRRAFEVVDVAEDGDRISKILDLIIMILILINVISVIVATFPISEAVQEIFDYIEIVSVIIFTVEYILRMWTSEYLYPNLSPLKARLRYCVSFMAIIDLFAILPFYLPFIIPVDLRVLRILRVVRLIRIFKFHRYTSALSTIGQVFKDKASLIISSMIVVVFLLLIASVLMYDIENEAQPDKFENAFSGLWWAFVTLTTVGYGDIYPITTLGKFLGMIISLLGIGLVAVPTGIISAGFIEQVDKGKHKADPAPDITDDKKQALLSNFELLNSTGELKLLEYSSDLLSSGNYSKPAEENKSKNTE